MPKRLEPCELHLPRFVPNDLELLGMGEQDAPQVREPAVHRLVVGFEHGGHHVGGGRRAVAEIELGDGADQVVARVGSSALEQRFEERR